jgi:putative ABC transport system permease protein
VLDVRDNVRVAQGRFLTPGLYEIVVGRNAAKAYQGLDLGRSVRIGPGTWTVVGIFDAGGSAFDSEIWADAAVLNANYGRPPAVFQSVTARLRSAADFPAFEAAVERDPRIQVQAQREQEYYASQSTIVTALITVLGGLVAMVMGLGAIIGALNTMYSAVAERGREIAVLRALGFRGGSIILSFLFESMWIALIGGVVGCLVVLPINGLTTGTINWQTFSHLSFAFKITPGLLLLGVAFALCMGIVGGVPPAIRAARANVATTIRAL